MSSDNINKTPLKLPIELNQTKNIEQTKNVANNIIEVLKDKTQEIRGYTPSKFTVIIGLAFVIILCIFISYGLYYYIGTSIFQQSRIIIDGTKLPILCNQLNEIPITSFNDSGNGQRRSYTFWIYINDLNKYSNLYKHVLHIGENGPIKNCSPYIFMDKTENKLNVRFSAIQNDSFVNNIQTVQNLNDNDKNLFMQQGIEIPYIPIQRWVHVAIVVNENSNGGTIVAYVDGDISKMVSSGTITDEGTPIKISNLNLDKKGNLIVGGNNEGINGPGFSGLISKFSIYNYDLNDKDIYADYNEGPIDGLAALGLGVYGVRSPVYRIA